MNRKDSEKFQTLVSYKEQVGSLSVLHLEPEVLSYVHQRVVLSLVQTKLPLVLLNCLTQTELPEGLNQTRLRSILQGYGEYPAKYRYRQFKDDLN